MYLKEHASCDCYSGCIRKGFSYHKFSGMDANVDINVGKGDCILFVMEGMIEMSYDDKMQKLSAGNMIYLNRECFCKISPRGKGSILVMRFDKVLQGCDKFSLSQLGDVDIPDETDAYPLEIKDRLNLFLKLMIGYLEDKVCCAPFHEMKIKELFWLIQLYYTKTEQALFFRPLLGNGGEFKRNVMKYYRNAMTVKELSRLCGVTGSSFRRNFLKEFGEPASVWLQKQINNVIELRLADEDMSIGDIAAELHFSSHPQFCRYCKKNFGHTPKEWRKILKDRNVSSEGSSTTNGVEWK